MFAVSRVRLTRRRAGRWRMRRENRAASADHWDGRSYRSECSRCVLPHYPVKQKKTVEACGYTQRHSNSAACSRCRAAAHRKFVPHYLVFPCYCWFLFLFLRILSEFSQLFLWHILKTHFFFFLFWVSFCIHANLLSCLSLWVGVCCSGRASAPWTRWRTSKGASPFPFLALRPLRRTNSRSR